MSLNLFLAQGTSRTNWRADSRNSINGGWNEEDNQSFGG